MFLLQTAITIIKDNKELIILLLPTVSCFIFLLLRKPYFMHQQVRVVIVDNNESNRQITAMNFTDINWIDSVKIVNNAADLLFYLNSLQLQEYQPALIIVDYDLPYINGEDLLELLTAHIDYRHIEVAFYSSNLNDNIRKRLNALGIRYFKRPLTILGGERLAEEIKAAALRTIRSRGVFK
jgi:CheY-like chemotaxis protein